MKKRKNTKKVLQSERPPVFQTLAAVDSTRTAGVERVQNPDEGSIRQAKDWVDANEK